MEQIYSAANDAARAYAHADPRIVADIARARKRERLTNSRKLSRFYIDEIERSIDELLFDAA